MKTEPAFKRSNRITINDNEKQLIVTRVKPDTLRVVTLRWYHRLWTRFRNRIWGLFHKLEIELLFTTHDIKRLSRLGLSKDQIRKVAEVGLFPDNSIHWHYLVVAKLENGLDELLDCPPKYISQRYRKRG